jgi:hypothetical protein
LNFRYSGPKAYFARLPPAQAQKSNALELRARDPSIRTPKSWGNVGTLSGWQGSNLVAELEPEFSVPVAVEDDVNAAAFA